MELKMVRSLWGIEIPLEQSLPKLKAEGYTLIETPLPAEADATKFMDQLGEHGFKYVAMGFTDGATPADHAKSFRAMVERGAKLGAVQMTVHSGKDAWSMSEAEAFYREVVAIEKDAAIPVGHETHRGRTFFNPWTTRDVLRKFDALKLVCDFSHWVCVAERLNWDDADGSIVKLCADRTLHVHARVGYPEGPQVPDPSAPEYADAVEQHLKWWDVLWASQKSRGMKATTVTPEFGPPGYLHTLPHTNVPVANLWKVCNWMAEKVRGRFRE